jgi:hypothetical protein
MTDPARLALAAVAAAAIAFGWAASRLARVDSAEPGRLVGELRFAQWVAVALAVTAGWWMGLAMASPDPVAAFDVSLSVGVALASGLTLTRDPREGLLWLLGLFLGHALLDIAHRPGGLSTSVAPQWFVSACAVYDVYMAALCFLVRRR